MDESEASFPLAEVASCLDGAGITWVVFAGAAARAYGSTRPLTDVDILVPACEADRLAILFPEAEVRRTKGGHVSGVTLPGLDVLAGLALLDLDPEMAGRLTYHEIAGVRVPVIPVEDNILLKALWGRGAEQGKHDWEDVQAMMAHAPELDWVYLSRRAGACGSPERVRPVLARLRALWRRMVRLRRVQPRR